MKKIVLLLISILLFTAISSTAYVIIYPGVTFYGTNITVTTSNPSGINVSYFEVGNKYVRLGAMNLSMSGTSVINISRANSNHIVSKGISVLRFNSTTTTTISYTFTGNCTNPIYKLYRNNTLVSTYSSNSFSWSRAAGTHDFDIRVDTLCVDPPYAGSSKYTTYLNTVNLTWTSGNFSDTDVVVMKAGSYPSSPSDGHVYQNNTKNYYNFTVNQSGYFTIWSYNATSHFYSCTGLNIPWGAMKLRVFNASKTWQVVSPFSLKIHSSTGTSVYENTSCTSPHYINLVNLPLGANSIIIINASKYKQQTFIQTIAVNNFYNLTFLLPPVTTTTPGAGDDGTNITTTQVYLISVIDEANRAVSGAVVKFQIYKNSTTSYNDSGGFVGDGYGQGTINLIPNALYRVLITCTGYKDATNFWTPSNALFTKTFQLEFTDVTPQPPIVEPEMITFTCNYQSDNNSLYLYYLDTSGYTTVVSLKVTMYDPLTSTWSEIGIYNYTSVQTVTKYIEGLNSNNTYQVNLTYNNQYLGIIHKTCVHEMIYTPPTSPAAVAGKFSWVGIVPFGISNFLMWLFFLATMYYVDSRDAGKIIIADGVIFLFVGVFVNFNSTLLNVAGVSFPILFIVIGILMEWNESKKRSV